MVRVIYLIQPWAVVWSLSSRSKVTNTEIHSVSLEGGRECPKLNGRRLSTFELRTFSAMTPDRFAIIPVSPGPAPADAIMTGSMSAVMERIVDSQARADALEEAARAVEDAVEAQQKRDEALATTARDDCRYCRSCFQPFGRIRSSPGGARTA